MNTVEPLIKDPPSRQPPSKGHSSRPEIVHVEPLKRGQPLGRGQNGYTQSVPCKEVQV